jgi:hypothetical protein
MFEDIIQKANAAIEAATPEHIQREQEIEQKTKAWFEARLGFFNASDLPKLMTKGRGKDEVWGATARAVIDKVIVERSMTPEGREMYVAELMVKEFRQTRWGNEYELAARQLLSEAIGEEIYEVGSIIHSEIPYFRGSADGVTASGIPVEIKCPYDPLKHQANLNLVHTGIDLKHEYYAQIQAHMMIHVAAKCYFASYDPRRRVPDNLAVIEVDRDEVFIAAIKERLEAAEDLIKDYLLTV